MSCGSLRLTSKPAPTLVRTGFQRGAKGTRTPDPHTASVVRYQLRHSPGEVVPIEVTPPAVSVQNSWSGQFATDLGAERAGRGRLGGPQPGLRSEYPADCPDQQNRAADDEGRAEGHVLSDFADRE